MEEEYAAPETASPPPRPSDWQLRFGRKSTSRSNSQQNKSKPEVDIHPYLGNQARSPSISERLLRALNTKPKTQEELGRECVDLLIGRRNAFASEPELRLRTLTKDSEDEDMVVQEEYGHEDVAAEAKEIIRARFQIETQADILRQVPGHKKLSKRRTENSRPPRACSSAAASTPATSNFTSRASTKLSRTAPQRHENKKPRTRLIPNGGELRSTKDTAKLEQRTRQERQPASSTVMTSMKSRSRVLPPQQLPMERRQQLLQQARVARKIKAAEERAVRKLYEPVSSDNNKEGNQAQRRIEEQIERLTLENQQAAAVEERLQHRKARLQSLNMYFDIWHRYVELKQEQEVRVAAEFNWRIMKCVMSSWKRYTHRQMQTKAAEQARLKLVREQQMNKQAKQFHRLKCLPTWFYRWTTFVIQQREHRAAQKSAEKRRAQTERLMERLQRQTAPVEENLHDSAENETVPNGSEVVFGQEITIEDSPIVNEQTSTCSAKTSVKYRQPRHECSSVESYQTAPIDNSSGAASTESSVHVPPPPQFASTAWPRTTKRADKVYKAMEQRAVERKQRREELKRRYEELDQKKREEQEEQRAAREALLNLQRMEEKARIRERKIAEALALKEKQERHDHMIDQRHKAARHNRQRLLFYYALLPWRKLHILNQRVARNATRWHELRTVYSHWERWQEFVHMCRKLRRRRERAQLEKALKHYARSLQRRALWGFMRYHQATEARVLAVQRQNQWNALRRTWTRWHTRLASERTYQRQVIVEVATKMQQAKLRRICAQWHKVTTEAKIQQELEREKQQLWRKVRGWLDEDK